MIGVFVKKKESENVNKLVVEEGQSNDLFCFPNIFASRLSVLLSRLTILRNFNLDWLFYS